MCKMNEYVYNMQHVFKYIYVAPSDGLYMMLIGYTVYSDCAY